MNIRGRKVVLRAIEENDLPHLHRWANDPDIWYMLGGWHFPGSMDFQKKWFEGLKNDHLNQHLAIEVPGAGIVGTSNIVEIDWKNNHAFHGMMLGSGDARGKGYGIDTVMATMRYAFEELHLERLDGSMIEYNTPSIGLYCKKLAWKEEGRQKNWYYRKNRYWDRIMVGILREEYFELARKMNYWE